MGFRGMNCTETVHDCSNNSCQFGVCINDVHGYRCQCDIGFTGQFCQIAPQAKSKYQKASPMRCTSDTCSNNGICYEESPTVLRCRCYLGFIGERCAMLKSIHSRANDSYMILPKPIVYPRLNITLVFSTKQNRGIIMYFGHVEHLVAELFMGRIRISYAVGNAPGSVMFSYDIVNDGNPLPRIETARLGIVL